MFLGVFRFTENMKFVLRPTLMHTKNLYENGPNPFFFRDQKHERRPSYAYGFGLLCFRQTWTGLPIMRVRCSNEIAEWKWPPIFQNEGEICKKEQTSWTSTVVVLLLYLPVKRIGGG